MKLIKKLIKLLKDEGGTTPTEYALIAFLIGVVIVGAVTLFGNQVNQLFEPIIPALGGE